VQPSPALHAGELHRTPEHVAPTPHTTSHAHDESHATPWQLVRPWHCTSHGPMPHCTVRHDALPLHVIAQLVPSVQSTPLRHELSTLHRTSHFQPIGHLTWARQFAPIAQSMTQLCIA
jgi:hypothetical protein